jgi:DNA polymerase III subunit epsilon
MESFPDVFCIVDTETTGMRAAFSRITDIAIIRVEKGKIVKKYETLVNPGVSLPSYIRSITGLTDEILSGAPTFEEVALEIKEMLKGAVFMAHNVTFDYSFVQSEFRRIGVEWSAPKLCSVALSRALFPEHRKHNLDAIMERYGLRCDTRHRAMPDAEVVLSFLALLGKKVPRKKLREAILRVLDRHSPKNVLEELPDSAGVYFFYGKQEELLYVGKSKHIRTRVRSHFHKKESEVGRMQEETERIETVRTSGELSALILEANLIKKESPAYNRALRKRKKLVVAKFSPNEEGYLTVNLEYTERLTADDSVLSVWRTMSQAKARLEVLAEMNKLCPKLLHLDSSPGSCFNYQLKKCDGACKRKISPEEYNKRVEEAFAKRKMKTWPYKGAVLICEEEGDESGTVFIVDNWTIKHAYRYDGSSYEPFLQGVSPDSAVFDYDTYKILARYMLDPKNKGNIRVLSRLEYRKQVSILTDTYEDVRYI